MEKCIFCLKNENQFDTDNCWTDEHIIPKSLGNEKLIIKNVCKSCNDKLGSNIDAYFVNHFLVKLKRVELGLRGESGKIPNLFGTETDQYGNKMIIDNEFKFRTVATIDESDGVLRAEASTKEEVLKMIATNLKRKNYSDFDINRIIDDEERLVHETLCYQPSINIPFEINIKKIEDFFLKIAYEFACFKIGDEYLNDECGITIRAYLNSLKNGDITQNTISEYVKSIFPIVKDDLGKLSADYNNHVIFSRIKENQLFLEIILFSNAPWAFEVLISNDASKYDEIISKNGCFEIIPVIGQNFLDN